MTMITKIEKQKIQDRFIKESTPYDGKLKSIIKELSYLQVELRKWKLIKPNHNYSCYKYEEIVMIIERIENKILELQNSKVETMNQIYSYKNGTRK